MENYLITYNKYLELNITCVDKIIFICTDKKEYYMFYNESSLINPNNFNVKFSLDGVTSYKNNIFYYVGFNENDKYDIIKKLNYSCVIIIDKDSKVIEEFSLKKNLLSSQNDKQIKLLNNINLINTSPFFIHKNKIKKYDITTQKNGAKIIHDNNKIIPHIQSVGVSIDEFERKTNSPDECFVMENYEKYDSSPDSEKKKIYRNMSSEECTENIAQFIKKTKSEALLEEYEVVQ
ncbi:hypothetical protein BMW23_0510 [Bodo saltans virus]|uniref:Uncharacterized protein n=1 Tax=Bodo saltans virus TaxID=2024608 RepID=A0A2H4UUM2_9VIRU|nr:hypothetical protein QJ851_gp0494 [Bodo saltans virus]ATZ80557.1 hypothetical protein BMW23_0510 [Bodo saltans virus]